MENDFQKCVGTLNVPVLQAEISGRRSLYTTFKTFLQIALMQCCNCNLTEFCYALNTYQSILYQF